MDWLETKKHDVITIYDPDSLPTPPTPPLGQQQQQQQQQQQAEDNTPFLATNFEMNL